MRQIRVPLIINQNISVAAKLKLPNIHLSMPDLRKYKNELLPFIQLGASVHSVSEAVEAQELGASYLIAGHIFSTDCKKGVPPRGLSFLTEVCDAVTIPVFAIGGISQKQPKRSCCNRSKRLVHHVRSHDSQTWGRFSCFSHLLMA